MNLDRISRYISLLLRHKPEVGNLTLDKNGWCDVKKLITAVNKKYPSFDMDTLIEIVNTDEKGRYSFNEGKILIRANQGHSVHVDVELKKETPPNVLYHGTATRFLDQIFKEGLKAKSRLYVHLSKDIKTATKVGGRHGKPIVLVVNTKKMVEDGFEFYLSANGVWLTKEVPAGYLNKI